MIDRANGLTTVLALVVLAGCGPKVVVVTGTTLGLKATPGDGQTRPPQVTFGYKRAETAIVPTDGQDAGPKDDAYSVLAAFDFQSEWFGKTELSSFIASGNAARDIQGENDEFINEVAATALPVTAEMQTRKTGLIARWKKLSDPQSATVLTAIKRPVQPHNTASEELQDAIAQANTPGALAALEQAFASKGF